MKKKIKVLAVIPARKGSKRIKNKNIKIFNGKPMIYWPIQELKKTKIFDKILVSTDSLKIKSYAQSLRIDAPFVRPKDISDDFSPTIDVVNHAIRWLKNKGLSYDYICCVYPTAVLMKKKFIIDTFKLIKKNNKNFVFPASKFEYPILRSFKRVSNGNIKMPFPKYFKYRSQDLEEYYHDAGQFYWGKADSWLKLKPIFSKSSTIIKIPRLWAHDIDTLEDWKRAEIMHKVLQQINQKI